MEEVVYHTAAWFKNHLLLAHDYETGAETVAGEQQLVKHTQQIAEIVSYELLPLYALQCQTTTSLWLD